MGRGLVISDKSNFWVSKVDLSWLLHHPILYVLRECVAIVRWSNLAYILCKLSESITIWGTRQTTSIHLLLDELWGIIRALKLPALYNIFHWLYIHILNKALWLLPVVYLMNEMPIPCNNLRRRNSLGHSYWSPFNDYSLLINSIYIRSTRMMEACIICGKN